MAIRNRVDKLAKRCSCKQNMCMSKQRGCKQKGLTCGPGCQCINCKNAFPSTAPKELSPMPGEPAQSLHFQRTIIAHWRRKWTRTWLRQQWQQLRSDPDTASTNDSDSADDMWLSLYLQYYSPNNNFIYVCCPKWIFHNHSINITVYACSPGTMVSDVRRASFNITRTAG